MRLTKFTVSVYRSLTHHPSLSQIGMHFLAHINISDFTSSKLIVTVSSDNNFTSSMFTVENNVQPVFSQDLAFIV